jgi:hypothetical protein
MPGANNMGISLLWCVGGGLLTLITIAANLGITVVFYGAILVGALQFVEGPVQFFLYQVQVLRFKAQHHLQRNDHLPLQVFVQSMIAMSIADGKLDKAEAKVIKEIHQQVTGVSMKTGEIYRLGNKMKEEGFSIRNALLAVNSQLDDELKSLIV